MRTEKILAVYPTIVKGGLAVTHPMPPDPLFLRDKFPASCKFYLTSLIYICNGKQYTTELDVLLDGKSVLPDSDSDKNTMETTMFTHIDDGHIMVSTSFYINTLRLVKTGVYDVVFRIYEEIDGALGQVVDEKKCAIIATERNGASL